MRTEREGRTPIVLLGVLVVLSIVIPAFGVGMVGPGRMGMMWDYGSPGELPATGGRGWGLTLALGALAMPASWGALLVGVALLVRWLAQSVSGTAAGRSASEDEALAILRRRYAAGELDQATYERMRRELRAPPRQPS